MINYLISEVVLRERSLLCRQHSYAWVGLPARWTSSMVWLASDGKMKNTTPSVNRGWRLSWAPWWDVSSMFTRMTTDATMRPPRPWGWPGENTAGVPAEGACSWRREHSRSATWTEHVACNTGDLGKRGRRKGSWRRSGCHKPLPRWWLDVSRGYNGCLWRVTGYGRRREWGEGATVHFFDALSCSPPVFFYTSCSNTYNSS